MLDFSRVGDWIITETDFDPAALGKAEANFCLGNGYLGLRYTLMWRGQQLRVEVTDREVTVINLTGTAPVEAELRGETRSFTDRITAAL